MKKKIKPQDDSENNFDVDLLIWYQLPKVFRWTKNLIFSRIKNRQIFKFQDDSEKYFYYWSAKLKYIVTMLIRTFDMNYQKLFDEQKSWFIHVWKKINISGWFRKIISIIDVPRWHTDLDPLIWFELSERFQWTKKLIFFNGRKENIQTSDNSENNHRFLICPLDMRNNDVDLLI